ncbi:type II toxin-antitoxin system Phd/YefM family antitoxin [Tunturiibacter lichenicola]|uniref:type II toxin-antitoxin system Phd/YefM family antitoxin n=1 Tax=Tunturiibacter lichenicola TaxID=2051959 RepID=UPI0021B22745|nr:type II toxin-antitoxin system prevent-host-death family antitoxin [Edaphobacter lichenicola]
MRRVSLREANQNFSSCVAEVEAGESLILVRRGKPVARIVPFSQEEPRDSKHEAAVKKLAAFLKDGLDLGGIKVNREELYDRGH